MTNLKNMQFGAYSRHNISNVPQGIIDFVLHQLLALRDFFSLTLRVSEGIRVKYIYIRVLSE